MLHENHWIPLVVGVLLRQPAEAVLGQHEDVADEARLGESMQLVARVPHARLRGEVVHHGFGEGERARRRHDLLERDGLAGLLGLGEGLQRGRHLIDEGADGGVVGFGEDGVLTELDGVG